MHRATYLVVFLGVFGCGGPREYQKGTYRPPPPPVMRPGVGAPSVGQPGWNPGVRTIPGPKHGRILPETPETRKEPGIWAVKEEDPGELRRTLLDTLLPLPKDPSGDEVRLVEGCVFLGKRALAVAVGTNDVRAILDLLGRMSAKDEACVAARSYQECASHLLDVYATKRRAGTILDPVAERELRRVKETADNFVKKMCGGGLSKDASELIKGVRDWFVRDLANLKE